MCSFTGVVYLLFSLLITTTIAQELPINQTRDGSYWLFRVLGNDLPPLQSSGQTYKNLKYILENEGELPQAKKAFLLNRIVDEEQHNLLLGLLKSHNIPDDMIIDRPIDWNIPMTERSFAANYFHRINEARNMALEYAFNRGAEWVILNDGNSFIPLPTWDKILETSKNDQFYITTPLVRLVEEQNPSWLNSSTTLFDLADKEKIAKEPQEGTLFFRFDAPRRFDEKLLYSRNNKWNLVYDVCGAAIPELKFKKKIFVEGCTAIDRPVIRLYSFPEPDGVIAIDSTANRGAVRRKSMKNFMIAVVERSEKYIGPKLHHSNRVKHQEEEEEEEEEGDELIEQNNNDEEDENDEEGDYDPLSGTELGIYFIVISISIFLFVKGKKNKKIIYLQKQEKKQQVDEEEHIALIRSSSILSSQEKKIDDEHAPLISENIVENV